MASVFVEALIKTGKKMLIPDFVLGTVHSVNNETSL